MPVTRTNDGSWWVCPEAGCNFCYYDLRTLSSDSRHYGKYHPGYTKTSADVERDAGRISAAGGRAWQLAHPEYYQWSSWERRAANEPVDEYSYVPGFRGAQRPKSRSHVTGVPGASTSCFYANAHPANPFANNLGGTAMANNMNTAPHPAAAPMNTVQQPAGDSQVAGGMTGNAAQTVANTNHNHNPNPNPNPNPNTNPDNAIQPNPTIHQMSADEALADLLQQSLHNANPSSDLYALVDPYIPWNPVQGAGAGIYAETAADEDENEDEDGDEDMDLE